MINISRYAYYSLPKTTISGERWHELGTAFFCERSENKETFTYKFKAAYLFLLMCARLEWWFVMHHPNLLKSPVEIVSLRRLNFQVLTFDPPSMPFR